MKKNLLLLFALLFVCTSFSQVAYLQYRNVPAEHEEKFVERETKHWSKVAKAAILIPSSWQHVAQHYQIPSVLIQDEVFYNRCHKHMEESRYDFTWHPDVRDALRKSNSSDVIPIEEDNFRVVWGTKFEAKPEVEVANIIRLMKEVSK